MGGVKDFFHILGFDLNKDLDLKTINIGSNDIHLELNALFYKTPNRTNTSFYLIDEALTDNELEQVRKYIWNEDEADLIFYHDIKESKLKLIYAKASPKIDISKCLLDTFSDKDSRFIDSIKRWQFDSGAFWLKYQTFIHKSIFRGIDKELISTLDVLKQGLHEQLSSLITDPELLNQNVQALIDRTLYIKYLEDNHIINSFFYTYYFQDSTLNYRKLLEGQNKKEINELFKHIHTIFNNNLFDLPTIDDRYLTGGTCELIARSFNTDLQSNQLRLFDFQFDVLPTEFISYVYEIFLSEKQKDNGIYYTPKKLAQLIIDDVIHNDQIGPILDPSCGSGMFLIVGYQRLLEIARKQKQEPKDDIEKIKFRSKLLAENIFGIEKQLTAQRFTLFSLSLQIFKDIPPYIIKAYIANQLEKNNEIKLFKEHNFYGNIIRDNSLNTDSPVFKDKSFSYVVGNPPFFEIPNTDEFKGEISFLNNYTVDIGNNKKQKAKNIVGKHQISQCFLIKIKDWSNEKTRFGFVVNSSNFYNDKSYDFQHFFFSQYNIEKFYELSRVKKILFEKAKESVVSIIFNNTYIEDNDIKYYPVEMGLFSEKPFQLLVIHEDKKLSIPQKRLKAKEIMLRDYMVGNEFDLALFDKLYYSSYRLKDLILKEDDKLFIYAGIKVVGEEAAIKEFQLSLSEWKQLTKEQQYHYHGLFKRKYTSPSKSDYYNVEMVKPRNIVSFSYKNVDTFLPQDISNFGRGRNPKIYLGDKIIFNRTGNTIKSFFSKNKIYFDFDLHALKLTDANNYHLVNAILNSQFANYYINTFLRKRVSSSYPKIGNEEIINLPIPKHLDLDTVEQINKISQELTERKYIYSLSVEQNLNDLVFALYGLSYTERQRVKDFFLKKEKIGHRKSLIKKYSSALSDSVNFYLNSPVDIEFSSVGFNLIVAKVSLNKSKSDTPSTSKVQKYILNEVFEENPNENLFSCQEKVFGKNCVYIIKSDTSLNWTETKAFEDGQDIIKNLISYANGERVH